MPVSRIATRAPEPRKPSSWASVAVVDSAPIREMPGGSGLGHEMDRVVGHDGPDRLLLGELRGLRLGALELEAVERVAVDVAGRPAGLLRRRVRVGRGVVLPDPGDDPGILDPRALGIVCRPTRRRSAGRDATTTCGRSPHTQSAVTRISPSLRRIRPSSASGGASVVAGSERVKVGCRPIGADAHPMAKEGPDAHRDRRHPRHPRRVRRVRDAARGSSRRGSPPAATRSPSTAGAAARTSPSRSRRASAAGSCRASPASTSRRCRTRRCRCWTAWSAATTRCGSATPRTRSFCGIPRLRGTRVVLNVDGIERQRQKWGLGGPAVVRRRRAVRARLPERHRLRRRGHPRLLPRALRPRVRRSSPTARRCSTASRRPTSRATGWTGRRAGRYLLYVSRLEPENQADLVIRAYRDVPGDMPLLIVGDAPYADGVQGSACASSRPAIRGSG